MVQCVAVWWCGAVYCIVLYSKKLPITYYSRHISRVAVCCSVYLRNLPNIYSSRHISRVAVCSSVLQCVAACCSVLQCVAVCIRGTCLSYALYGTWHATRYLKMGCSVLQCVAVWCSVVQCAVFEEPAYSILFMTHVT